jgi:hypothetical protein
MLIFQDMATWRFWRHFLISSFAIVGFFSTILQTSNVIFPKFHGFEGWYVFLGLSALSLLGGLALSWPRPILQEYEAPQTRIRITKGNLLKENDHLVVGACDTFDTDPPVVISPTSLQAQVLQDLFGGDVKELDRQLTDALAGIQPVNKITKTGKQDKYPIGTIATVKQAGRLLFFLAYTQMDNKNVATGTVDGIWKSLAALWEEVSNRGNGRAVCVPVIGGGQARLSNVLPAQDSIRFIVLSFILASRGKKICDELRIVVSPDQYKKLDRLELQSFLASLRAS